ncbi:MAG: DNA-deoxyinosine glycosylase [Sphingomonadaceae bacterium]
MTVHSHFEPVVDAATRVLILGSLPGAVSLARRQYYGHPRNQFWRLAGALIERDIAALPYEARLAALRDAGIGLWDTVARARREGSLDAAIRDHEPADLGALTERLPHLRAIGFNGKTAARIGRRQIGETRLALVDLPSSSPAYTLPFADKRERWLALRSYLGR